MDISLARNMLLTLTKILNLLSGNLRMRIICIYLNIIEWNAYQSLFWD